VVDPVPVPATLRAALAILPEADWANAVSTAASHGIHPRIENPLDFARRSRVLLMRHAALIRTAVRGGISNQGILFEVTPTGVETVLYHLLAAPDGANPGPLIQGADGIFYDTTAGGGSSGQGTVFVF
jgi:hypothetical protein